MREVIDLIHWCFRSEGSGFCTIIVMVLVGGFIIRVIEAFRNK